MTNRGVRKLHIYCGARSPKLFVRHPILYCSTVRWKNYTHFAYSLEGHKEQKKGELSSIPAPLCKDWLEEENSVANLSILHGFLTFQHKVRNSRLENKRVLALAPKIAEFASKLRLLLTPSAGNFFTAAAKRGVKPKLVFLLSIQGFVIRGSSWL